MFSESTLSGTASVDQQASRFLFFFRGEAGFKLPLLMIMVIIP